jgi:HTH-type transcriptional regulator/antitoxin HigA
LTTEMGSPRAGSAGRRYFELVRSFPLRPLRSDEELDRAVAVIDALLGQASRDEGEDDYLDVLSDLVEKYESTHHPIPPASDAEVLRFLITDAKGVSQAQVADETGIPQSTISEVLSGKRGLSRRNIGVLARYFHVNPSVFSFD